MTPRENILKAIKKDGPQYVPHGISLCPSQIERLKAISGHSDVDRYFDLPYRYVELLPSSFKPDYRKYYSNLPENVWIDQWGVARIKSDHAHFNRMLHPMESFTSPDEVTEFPLPDLLADYRWEGFEEQVERIKQEGYLAVFSAIQIFEYAWYLRGMENLLMDMIDNEGMAGACLNKMTDIQAKLSSRLARYGVDMIVFGDDVASQRGMLLRPDMWRTWLKPGIKAVIWAAKEENPDIIAYYHSDGDIYEIIPDLIEIGVDVLNPIQPECMDPIRIKHEFGDRLSFWGTIGTQTTMPFGTPEEVEKNVRKMIETVGQGAGFVIAPTHLIEPEVPWENIMAFYESVKKYRYY